MWGCTCKGIYCPQFLAGKDKRMPAIMGGILSTFQKGESRSFWMLAGIFTRCWWAWKVRSRQMYLRWIQWFSKSLYVCVHVCISVCIQHIVPSLHNKICCIKVVCSCKLVAYICTGGAAWRPVIRGPMRITLYIEIQGELCFPLYICLYCLNFLHEHVLFIEPEIAHRKLFSLKGEKEMKEACSGPGTLWLSRPEPPHWRW